MCSVSVPRDKQHVKYNGERCQKSQAQLYDIIMKCRYDYKYQYKYKNMCNNYNIHIVIVNVYMQNMHYIVLLENPTGIW